MKINKLVIDSGIILHFGINCVLKANVPVFVEKQILGVNKCTMYVHASINTLRVLRQGNSGSFTIFDSTFHKGCKLYEENREFTNLPIQPFNQKLKKCVNIDDEKQKIYTEDGVFITDKDAHKNGDIFLDESDKLQLEEKNENTIDNDILECKRCFYENDLVDIFGSDFCISLQEVIVCGSSKLFMHSKFFDNTVCLKCEGYCELNVVSREKSWVSELTNFVSPKKNKYQIIKENIVDADLCNEKKLQNMPVINCIHLDSVGLNTFNLECVVGNLSGNILGDAKILGCMVLWNCELNVPGQMQTHLTKVPNRIKAKAWCRNISINS